MVASALGDLAVGLDSDRGSLTFARLRHVSGSPDAVSRTLALSFPHFFKPPDSVNAD